MRKKNGRAQKTQGDKKLFLTTNKISRMRLGKLTEAQLKKKLKIISIELIKG